MQNLDSLVLFAVVGMSMATSVAHLVLVLTREFGSPGDQAGS